jgi:hypothetical protein
MTRHRRANNAPPARKSSRRAGSTLAALLCLVLPAPALRAHDSRDSVAEATLNRDRNCLEITVSVHIDDLELALTRAAARPVSLERDSAGNLDPEILAYLAAEFEIKDDQGAGLKLKWIGREPVEDSAHQAALLHFEAVLPPSAKSLTLHQRMFCELHEDQINLVEFRDGDRKLILGFSPRHGARTIPL